MHLKRPVIGWRFGAALAFFVAANIGVAGLVLGSGASDALRQAFLGFFDKKLDLPGIDEGSWSGSVKRTARSLIRVVPRGLSGNFPAHLDHLDINVKFKHLRILRADRIAAIEKGMLLAHRTVPAKIRVGSHTYRARIRLKGDFPDHWASPDRWSLRVRLKDGATLFGMKQFSLHKPVSRQIPDDMLFQAWMRAMGNLAPRRSFTRITFNGDYWGVMDVEEHMSQHFLEMSRRPQGPIFKFTVEDDWAYAKLNGPGRPTVPFFGHLRPSLFEEKVLQTSAARLALYDYALASLRGSGDDVLPVRDRFEIDAFANVFVAATAWAAGHVLNPANMRLYVNPFTLRIEPVTTDQQPPATKGLDLSVGMPAGGLFETIIRAPEFDAALARSLARARATLPALRKAYVEICAAFPLDCPDWAEQTVVSRLTKLERDAGQLVAAIRARAPVVAETQSPADDAPATTYFPAVVFGTYHDDGRLMLTNLVGAPLKVVSVGMVCDGDAECPTIAPLASSLAIPPSTNPRQPSRLTLRLPPDLRLGSDRRILVETRLGQQHHRAEIALTFPGHRANPFRAAMPNTEGATLPPYLVERGAEIHVLAGQWAVTAPIVVGHGRKLVITPGADLAFAPDAYILSRGPIVATGTPTAPIRLHAATAAGWPGVMVIDAGDKSMFQHVRISNTRAFQAGLLQATGGVTFYRSDVTFSDAEFSESRAEDALNVIGSTFAISDSTFRATRSDGLDSDFSEGTLARVSFEDIGGDGLDAAGSEINGNALRFVGIHDKAVSAGEASRLQLDGVTVRGAGAGIVSKDGSNTTVVHLSVTGAALFAAMAYQKKTGYGPASLAIEGTDLDRATLASQAGNVMTLNGEAVPQRPLDVDALYASGPMRKIGTAN